MNRKNLIGLLAGLLSIMNSQAMRYGPSAQDIANRKATRLKFLELQAAAGLSKPDMSVQKQIDPRTQGTLAQINSVRKQLNDLFSKSPLDVEAVKKKITELAALKPALRPGPEEYAALLVKVGAKGIPSAPTAPKKHADVQEEFVALKLKVLSKSTSDADKQSMRKIQPLTDQKTFNTIRAQLNELLAKDALSDADVKQINDLIIKLDNLKPARWPRAEDYKEVLNKKIGK